MSGKRNLNPKIKEYGKDILKSENFRKMKEFKQHGDVSVLSHSLRVAERSLKFTETMAKFHIYCDEEAVVRGALLHDYFLYDWHEKSAIHNLHGFRHAGTALKNADKEYDLTPKERDIIEKHMFPLNIKPPCCREAWIVNLADTYCSTGETLMGRRKHEERRERIKEKCRKKKEREVRRAERTARREID